MDLIIDLPGDDGDSLIHFHYQPHLHQCSYPTLCGLEYCQDSFQSFLQLRPRGWMKRKQRSQHTREICSLFTQLYSRHSPKLCQTKSLNSFRWSLDIGRNKNSKRIDRCTDRMWLKLESETPTYTSKFQHALSSEALGLQSSLVLVKQSYHVFKVDLFHLMNCQPNFLSLLRIDL